jgi:hypothetical protein
MKRRSLLSGAFVQNLFEFLEIISFLINLRKQALCLIILLLINPLNPTKGRCIALKGGLLFDEILSLLQ